MRKLFILTSCFIATFAVAQKSFTPEMLWSLGRVGVQGISKDNKYIVYNVSTPDVDSNKSHSKSYKIPLDGGNPIEIGNAGSELNNNRVSPDGKYILSSKPVKMKKVLGADLYSDLPKTTAHVYTSLNYRHWDEWFDGSFDHVFFAPYDNGKEGSAEDIMPNDNNSCPQEPFGGDEDFIWHPDSKHIIYVTKKAFGTAYATSTNTDLFEYDITNGTTKNLTAYNKGYDIAPAFNKEGTLAWLQMKRDGYEADKQDIVVMNHDVPVNLTAHDDAIHVESFKWSNDGKTIFFIAPVEGTLQIFEVKNTGLTKMLPLIRRVTKGDFDVNEIVGQVEDKLIVTRNDIAHAADIFSVDIKTGEFKQLTHINDETFNNLPTIKTERRWVTTTDNKKMMEWIIYPPNFDASKKYPVLLYCQGGPQSAISQFFSYRWNFYLMASQGYVVVAPCRRGMPGFGTKWNEQVSKDWGGQVINDYLSAIDNISKEKFIDTTRRAAVGASFGGFSVFALAGKHNGRFKTFIAHDGVFDFRSMYGTTDEMWFENWEKGGNYWDKKNAIAQRSFSQSPSNFVDKWNTPIMIVQGGKDYRVSIEQGQQAFQAAQLKGIKSKFLYFPDENHWVLKPQNGMTWQREFFSWLKETL